MTYNNPGAANGRALYGGGYRPTDDEHALRAHRWMDGQLYGSARFGGWIACYRPACRERYPEADR